MAVAQVWPELDETIWIEAWRDARLEGRGHDPRSHYVERYWLPILGPSTVFLLRHLTDRLEGSPEGFVLDLHETARALGLSERAGRHAPFSRTMRRAVDFNMARWTRDRGVGVRVLIPPLGARQLARLPERLRDEHGAGAALPNRLLSPERLAQRGRQLALSLLSLGESPAEAERRLLEWRYPAPLAAWCVRAAFEARRPEANRAPSRPTVPA